MEFDFLRCCPDVVSHRLGCDGTAMSPVPCWTRGPHPLPGPALRSPPSPLPQDGTMSAQCYWRVRITG